MADQDTEVVNALVRLMNGEVDPESLTDDQLVATLRALRGRKALEGRTAAELHRRQWTWPRIAELLGVDQSTVSRWAAPYLRDGEQ